jgi:hypothetical protein
LGARFGLLSPRMRGLSSIRTRSPLAACMMIARRLARATRALRVVDRLGIAKAQSLSLIWPLWRVDVSRATDADGSSIAATKARAVSCPTPGIVISRRQAAEALAIRLISGSNAATRRDDAESSGLGDVSDTELSPNPSRIRHAGLSVYGRWPTPRVDDGAKVFAGPYWTAIAVSGSVSSRGGLAAAASSPLRALRARGLCTAQWNPLCASTPNSSTARRALGELKSVGPKMRPGFGFLLNLQLV